MFLYVFLKVICVVDSSQVQLTCSQVRFSHGVPPAGRPAPHVTWWNEETLLDDVIEDQSAQVTVNTLTLPALTRSDLYLVLTCKASNSNLSVPLAAAVTIDMSCK